SSRNESKPVTKKRVKGKQGGLKNCMTLPIDVFGQVAVMLDPGDLVVLARINKFFRNLLMSRSATRIWRQSFKNISDLPECPMGMCEPQYAALVFSPYCTYCGKPVRRQIDTELRVRLCSACVQKCTVHSATIEWELSRYIPMSEDGFSHYLRIEVDFVTAKITELLASGNESVLRQWKAERQDYILAREDHSERLRSYLDSTKEEKEDQVNTLRERHESQILTRLRALGWTYEGDFNFDASAGDKKLWNALNNRKRRLVKEKKDRIACVLWEMNQTWSHMPLVTMEQSLRTDPPDQEYEPSSTSGLIEPFPQEADISRWKVIQDLVSFEFTPRDAAKIVPEHEEIWQTLEAWQRNIENYFANLVRQEHLGNDIPKPRIVRDSLVKSFHPLSDDAAILLRADSLFYAISGLPNYAYSYSNALAIPRSAVNKDISSPNWHLSVFQLLTTGSSIARVLLQSIGRPDASFLEFHEVQRFFCNRCGIFELMSWEEIVNHFALEQTKWEKMQDRIPTFKELEIAYNYAHNLTSANDPPIKLLTIEEALAFRLRRLQWPKNDCQCRLCDRASVKYLDIEESMVAYVRNVHGIAEPDSTEHFKIKKGIFMGHKRRGPNKDYIVW
ncbi:hypothetical protein FRC07_001905, partial [Ceratobasidium sp. 392]